MNENYLRTLPIEKLPNYYMKIWFKYLETVMLMIEDKRKSTNISYKKISSVE